MADERLAKLRKQLDKVNQSLFDGILEREQLVHEVFLLKKELQIDRHDPEREAKMMTALRDNWESARLSGKAVPAWSSMERIFKTILEEALRHEI